MIPKITLPEGAPPSPCLELLDHALNEINDLLVDCRPVDIRLFPGGSGWSSYLFWKPADSDQEASIREHQGDVDPPDQIRQVWLLGEPLASLRDFLQQAESMR